MSLEAINISRPKIGFLTERLLLGFGVDLVVHEYASFLQSRGYDTEVFCLRNEGSLARTYRVTNLNACKDLDFTPCMSTNMIRLAEFFNAIDIDLWVVNTAPFYDVIPLLAKPTIVIEYGTPPSRFFNEQVGRNLESSVSYRFDRVFSRLRRQDKILCISESIYSWLPAKVHWCSEVLYLGCDHYPEVSVEEARKFRHGLNIKDDAFMLLWVGRVQPDQDEQPYKGFSELLDLAKQLHSVEPEIKIVLVGRAGDKEESFLKSHNIIPSLNLPDSLMGAAYAASDLFISTSRWEGFNLPLLEAQYQGTPVVAYRHGPHPEVVSDAVTGYLVTDLAEMRVTIQALIRDPEAISSLARQAKIFAKGFSWHKSFEGLEKVVQMAAVRASSGEPGGSPRIDVNGLRRYVYLIEDIYIRNGLMFLIKRTIKACKRRIFAALRIGVEK